MSRLKELIAGLCPDGVEYKRIGDVCTIHARIGWQRLTKREYQTSGDYLLITGTDFNKSYDVDYSTCVYVSEERYMQDPKIQLRNEDVLITKDGTLGKVAQVKNLMQPATLNSGVFVVRSRDGSLNQRFILYYLTSRYFMDIVEKRKTKGTISHLNQKLFTELLIPIPPLEVQAEIVRILDKFTSLTAELTAELTLRRQQYEYYRDKLLTFGDDVRRVALGEIGKVCMCKRILKRETSPDGTIPFYKIGTFGGKPDAYISRQLFELYKNKYSYPKKGDVLISAAGTIGKLVIFDGEDAYFQDSNIVWIDNDESLVLNRFLYYIYQTQPWKVTKGGTIKRLYNDNIANVIIPLPPIDQQIHIASILDRFDSLCNNLLHGLPAEISARRKQYEYYRDKLLAFTPKS